MLRAWVFLSTYLLYSMCVVQPDFYMLYMHSTISSKWWWLCKRVLRMFWIPCNVMCSVVFVWRCKWVCVYQVRERVRQISVCEFCQRCKSLHQFTDDARIKWWGSPNWETFFKKWFYVLRLLLDMAGRVLNQSLLFLFQCDDDGSGGGGDGDDDDDDDDKTTTTITEGINGEKSIHFQVDLYTCKNLKCRKIRCMTWNRLKSDIVISKAIQSILYAV